MNGPIENWLSARLFALTTRLVPPGQRGWSEAMRAESSYLPTGARLRWACGCLLAAFKLRFAPMQTGSFRINRWVMLVEALGCFAFLAVAWWEFTFGPSGVVRLNGEIIDKVFMGSPGGGYLLGLMIAFAFTGLVGPIGVWLGIRYAFVGRALDNRGLGYALIALPVIQWIAGAIGRIWMGSGDYATAAEFFVLFTVLPIACLLHLMYLAKPESQAPTDARLAAT
jgi:hypothetical protein